MSIEERISVKVTADIKDYLDNMGKVSAGTIATGNIISSFLINTAKQVVKFGIDAVKAYADEEQVVLRLSNAVGKDATKSMIDFAKAQQTATTFSDDAIMSLQTQLSQYGVLPGSINEATLAVIKYASGTGKSLGDASTVITQALAGQDRMLKRMGLDLDVNATRTENLARVTKFLTDKFRDSDTLMKNSVMGTYQNFKNRLEDMKEMIGEALTPVVRVATKYLGEFIDKVEEKNKVINADKTTIEGQIILLKAQIEHLKSVAEFTGKLTAEEALEIRNKTDILKHLKEIQEQEKKNLKLKEGVVEFDKNAGAERISALKKEIKTMGEVAGEITSINALEVQKRELASKTSFEKTASYSQQMKVALIEDSKTLTEQFVTATKTMVSGFASGTADMIMEGRKFSDVLGSITRDIARMFIEQGVKNMVASFIGGLGQMQTASSTANITPQIRTGGGGVSMPTGGGETTPTTGPVAPVNTGPGIGGTIVSAGTGLAVGWALSELTSMATADTGQATGPTVKETMERDIAEYQDRLQLDDVWMNAFSGSVAKLKSANPTKWTDRFIRDLFDMKFDVREVTDSPLFKNELMAQSYNGTDTASVSDPSDPRANRFGLFQISVKDSAKKFAKQIVDNYLSDLQGEFGIKAGGLDATRGALLGLADGGIVRASPGGTLAVIGEGGKDEAVIPLDKANGMGMTVNITINGTFIEGDQTKWDKLVREKIVVPLERMRLKTANSVI